jgi:hypothetical protein
MITHEVGSPPPSAARFVHDRRVLTRVFAAAAVLLMAAAVSLLGPIHATGVRGTALRPHYVPFGIYSYVSTAGWVDEKTALAQAGIRAPDVAVHRRLEAAAGAAAVAALIGGVLLVRWAREQRRPPAW